MRNRTPTGKKTTPPRLKVALSDREQEILNLLAKGLSNKEIGDLLKLSQFTIKNHLARIFKKLNVRSRMAAVMVYLKK